MPNIKTGGRGKPPRKHHVATRATHRVRRLAAHWFDDEGVRAGIAEAEADFAAGRFASSDSLEGAQALLDSWK